MYPYSTNIKRLFTYRVLTYEMKLREHILFIHRGITVHCCYVLAAAAVTDL